MKTTHKTTKSAHATISTDTTNPEEPMTTKTAHAAAATTATTTSATDSTATSATSNVGLGALVTQLTAALDAAENTMGPAPVGTTAAAKRRRGKPRKGSEKALTQLAPIVKQYGLDSTSLNSDHMVARYQTAQTLAPLQTRLTKMAKRVDDDAFDAQADAWDMGLQFYSLLKRRAKNDGSVAKSIEPLEKAFAFRSSRGKEGKPTKMQTRVQARLKKTVALAQKHGVSVTVGADGGPTSIAGPAQAVAAAQAEMAGGGSAPTSAPAVAAPVVPAAPAAQAAQAAQVNGVAHS